MHHSILDEIDLTTPCLIVDEAKMVANISRLRAKANELGVTLRPHLKTVKSVDAAKHILGPDAGPATVSTLAEAEVFFDSGISDILYAVGIAPQKLDRVLALRARGCNLSIILDCVDQAKAVAQKSIDAQCSIPTLIEIDSDGHRGGFGPRDPALIDAARLLHESGGSFKGVITHAGESYTVSGHAAHAKFAEMERVAAVSAAEAIRAAGLPCDVVSVGSTPTAHAAENLQGVTELRAGVYVMFDLFMAGIGVCRQEDIALSVLTTVIGHQKKRGWTLIDAGWMAMSRDRGTAGQAVDQGYGVVCDLDGNIYPDLIVSIANQEHGIIEKRPGATGPIPEFPLGTRLRILPNHACATGAQHSHYNVLPVSENGGLTVWPRFGGW